MFIAFRIEWSRAGVFGPLESLTSISSALELNSQGVRGDVSVFFCIMFSISDNGLGLYVEYYCGMAAFLDLDSGVLLKYNTGRTYLHRYQILFEIYSASSRYNSI